MLNAPRINVDGKVRLFFYELALLFHLVPRTDFKNSIKLIAQLMPHE